MIIEKRDYYNRGVIEAIDAIESACSGLDGYEGFLTGTVLKYMFRWRWCHTFMATTGVIMDSSRSMWRSACARQR